MYPRFAKAALLLKLPPKLVMGLGRIRESLRHGFVDLKRPAHTSPGFLDDKERRRNCEQKPERRVAGKIGPHDARCHNHAAAFAGSYPQRLSCLCFADLP